MRIAYMLFFRLYAEANMVIRPDVLNTVVSTIWEKSCSARGLFVKGRVLFKLPYDLSISSLGQQ